MNQERFINTLLDNIQIIESEQIAVAVSGGMDSMCLAAGMHYIRDKKLIKNFSFIVLTVDHNLRSESTQEAINTMLFLKSYGIKTIILKWSHCLDVSLLSNLHQKARDARYNLMLQYCSENGISKLITAHNKDDQAETLIMRIMRGTGIDGIAGIPVLNYMHGIKIIRPMLSISRKEIELLYKNFNWGYYIIDPSNEDIKYTRGKIRTQLKSQFNSTQYDAIVSRLNLLAENAARAKDFLSSYTEDIFFTICKVSKLGFVTMNLSQFILLHEEIGLRILVLILNFVSGSYNAPRIESLKLFYTQLRNIEKWKNRTLWGCEIIAINNDNIIFIRENCAISHYSLKLTHGQNLWDNRFIISIDNSMEKEDIQSLKLAKVDVKTLNSKIITYKIFEPKALCKKILYTTPAIFYNEHLLLHPCIEMQRLTNKELNIKSKIIFDYKSCLKNRFI